MHRQLSTALALLVAALIVARPTSASVVVSPTLDELVAEAESIFIGEVVDVRSRWIGSDDNARIVTDVLFRVERVLKGAPRVQAQLEFLGGTVGETRIEVVGVPRFRVGDRDLLFVERDRGRVSALVGIAHGRFPLVRDPQSREDRVMSYDFEPVTDVTTIGSRRAARREGRGLKLRQFEDAIVERLLRTTR
jgi:hypothetical protein